MPGTPLTSAMFTDIPSVAPEIVTVGPLLPALMLAWAPVAPKLVRARAPSSIDTTVIAPEEPATKSGVVTVLVLGAAVGAASVSVNVPATAAWPLRTYDPLTTPNVAPTSRAPIVAPCELTVIAPVH